MISVNNEILRDRFIQSLKQRNMSDTTIKGIYKVINLFLKFLGEKSLKAVQDVDVKVWQINLMNQNKKTSTILRYSKIIDRFLNFLNVPVKIEYPQQPAESDIHFLTYNEIRLIYQNLISPREKAIISLFLEAGLKTAELINLRKKNLVEPTIILSPIKPIRIIDLNQKAQYYLMEYLNSIEYLTPDSYVFFVKHEHRTSPLSYSMLNFIFKGVIERIRKNTDVDLQITPQILRNTFIYQCLLDGVPINLIKIRAGLKSSYKIRKIQSNIKNKEFSHSVKLDKCSNCESEILVHMKVCPYCFNNINNFVCPNCSNPIFIDYIYCPYCGTKLKK
ncbi:MAG: tyrosine-type recombinase/integrase [Candidatus Odinarchaeia archaeon]